MLTNKAVFLGSVAVLLAANAPSAFPAENSPVRAPGAASCSALAAAGQFQDTRIGSARYVSSDPGAKLPAYCEVTGTISPTPQSHIGVVYRLPDNWNGKMVGLGGGGFAGNVTMKAAAPQLSQGYAVAQTDTGHRSPSGFDIGWILKGKGDLNKDQVIDFGYRAVHLMTAIGKDVVGKYYGRAQSRAYFVGCSTGGRQGLMEVQRYPDDYDGVVAGAPVYAIQTYTNAVLRTQFFHKDSASNITPEQLKSVGDAVLKACDEKDGLKDGIVTDPRQCKWDPAELQCRAGTDAMCLTPAQVKAVRNIYAGVTLKDGTVAADPLMRGGEPAWLERTVGTPAYPLGTNAVQGSPFISQLMAEDPGYDIMSFDPEKELKGFSASFSAQQIIAGDPEIAPFFKKGGKLILWHGFNDPGPSPLETIKYYEAVVKAAAPKLGVAPTQEGIGQDVRLFLAPGVYHCGGGPGVDTFDAAALIDNWVEKKEAPERIVAHKQNSAAKRPLCPYPALPYYKGQGNANDAESFVCR